MEQGQRGGERFHPMMDPSWRPRTRSGNAVMCLNTLARMLTIASILAYVPTVCFPRTGPARAEGAVSLQPVLSGLDDPLYVTNAHDGSGRLFVVEQAGFLYIAIGDGVGEDDPALRGQDITTLLGKLLRIDVDHPANGAPYSSPSSNPFFGPVPGADEIYAYGLRNPWRFSFDRATGQLYLGDVGQDEREEIDIITNGGNYGWSVWEGTRCNDRYPPERCTTAGFGFPVIEYTHTAGRCGVVGGYVYRGALGTVPPGMYVFGDLCTGEIFQGHSAGHMSVLLQTGLMLVSFGEDEAGELYVVDIHGSVYRLGGGILAAAVLPASRSVPAGATATAFATMIWTGSAPATGCSIAPITQVPASFLYQTTDPATNAPIGSPNTAVTIPAGGRQSFLIAFTPTSAFAPAEIQLSFACADTPAAPLLPQVNTLLLSSSISPAPDVVALSATTSGDGIVTIPGAAGTAAFSVATVNVGAADNITASTDVGSGSMPVNISICQTDPGSGQCRGAPAPAVTLRIETNATPTFAVFVAGRGSVPFDPAANRVNVRFTDSSGVTRGLTSVAVRTQ